MAAGITVERTIEWVDTDASGIVHNSVANRLLEAAESALMRREGLVELVPAMPRVRLLFEFRRMLRFGDEVRVGLRAVAVGRSSVTWAMEVLDPAGEVAITGEAVVVHVGPDGRSAPLPDAARAALLTDGGGASR